MLDNIVDILDYEYTRTGGYVTLKFESGWITRRKFANVIFNGYQCCSVSKKKIKEGLPGIHVQIKKRGYTRYTLSQTSVNKLLVGESVLEEGSEIEVSLKKYLNVLNKERRELEKQDSDLREALRKIKFNTSKAGKKLSACHRLLELITET